MIFWMERAPHGHRIQMEALQSEEAVRFQNSVGSRWTELQLIRSTIRSQKDLPSLPSNRNTLRVCQQEIILLNLSGQMERAATNFTVAENADQSAKSPKTGENFSMALCTALLLVSCVGLAGIFVRRKKSKLKISI